MLLFTPTVLGQHDDHKAFLICCQSPVAHLYRLLLISLGVSYFYHLHSYIPISESGMQVNYMLFLMCLNVTELCHSLEVKREKWRTKTASSSGSVCLLGRNNFQINSI